MSEGTGQKSSDGEVSEFIIFSKKEVISQIKCLNGLTFSSKNAYIACVKQLSV